MGKPKFSRKKYETPSHPWQEDRIKEENELIRKYGLKNKREVWKSQTRLRKYRSQARELLAKVATGDAQSKKESQQLIISLNRLNILPPNSTLDDVLTLNTESILSRRLQTLTYLKGLANTSYQARQLISHGHIAISDRRVTVPGYIVTKDEEGEIGYTSDSPLNDVMHPARPRADFKSVPIVKKDISKVEKKPTEPVKEEKEKSTKPQDKDDKKETKKEEPSKPEPQKQDEIRENKPEDKTKEKVEKEPKKEEKKDENKTKGE
jgi:small subunit ribosomal protein S4